MGRPIDGSALGTTGRWAAGHYNGISFFARRPRATDVEHGSLERERGLRLSVQRGVVHFKVRMILLKKDVCEYVEIVTRSGRLHPHDEIVFLVFAQPPPPTHLFVPNPCVVQFKLVFRDELALFLKGLLRLGEPSFASAHEFCASRNSSLRAALHREEICWSRT